MYDKTSRSNRKRARFFYFFPLCIYPLFLSIYILYSGGGSCSPTVLIQTDSRSPSHLSPSIGESFHFAGQSGAESNFKIKLSTTTSIPIA